MLSPHRTAPQLFSCRLVCPHLKCKETKSQLHVNMWKSSLCTLCSSLADSAALAERRTAHSHQSFSVAHFCSEARAEVASRGRDEAERSARGLQDDLRQALRAASAARAREQRAVSYAGRGEQALRAREDAG